mmetsp:Transcript_29207/g.87334  ORF Transcript_29207/g.87334 Transcript_29207/m.87334 type:complete len:86 (-) Transcript_29207:1262-1519(-)
MVVSAMNHVASFVRREEMVPELSGRGVAERGHVGDKGDGEVPTQGCLSPGEDADEEPVPVVPRRHPYVALVPAVSEAYRWENQPP